MNIAELTTAQMPPKLVTAEELLRDHGDQHCELIEGEIIWMSPPGYRRGRYETRISTLLSNHVDEHRLSEVASGDSGFIVSQVPDTVMGPDVAFVRDVSTISSRDLPGAV